MESKEMQRLRYRAKKYGLRCRRVGNGYRFYCTNTGGLVDSVNGLTCNYTMTRAGLENFLANLTAAKSNNNIFPAATLNVFGAS